MKIVLCTNLRMFQDQILFEICLRTRAGKIKWNCHFKSIL